MKLLLVEDNKRVATALSESLRDSYAVDVAHSGKAVLDSVNLPSYDLILLDLGLPDMGGQDVCRELRTRKINAPVIIVTGDPRIASKVDLLDCGADDYMTKPFSRDELKARIRAIMRRSDHIPATVKLKFADIELDPATRRVTRGGRNVELRRKEFDLLEYMMRNQNRTLSRAKIIDHVWENGEGLWTNAVDVHVKYLRDKIDRPFGSHYIKTIHGVGYRLEAESAEEDVVKSES